MSGLRVDEKQLSDIRFESWSAGQSEERLIEVTDKHGMSQGAHNVGFAIELEGLPLASGMRKRKRAVLSRRRRGESKLGRRQWRRRAISSLLPLQMIWILVLRWSSIRIARGFNDCKALGWDRFTSTFPLMTCSIAENPGTTSHRVARSV